MHRVKDITRKTKAQKILIEHNASQNASNILNMIFVSTKQDEESEMIIDIDTCDKYDAGIPLHLLLLCEYFEVYPEFYQFEGIFRVQGSAAYEKEIKARLKQKDYSCI